MTAPVWKRFWSKVALGPRWACWLWNAYVAPDGYGTFRLDGRKVPAHQVAYRLLVGPIPEGLELDHLCRVRHCVNPDHLEPVTHAENVLRGASPSALNARATHCVEGHPFDDDNTYVAPSGERKCRACVRRRVAEYEQRKAMA